jgi:hypothetical protein
MTRSGPGAVERWPALPYEEWMHAAATLPEFLHSTYEAAARRAGWDRAPLERPFEGRP